MGVFQVDQMLVGFIHAEDAYKVCMVSGSSAKLRRLTDAAGQTSDGCVGGLQDMPNPDAKAWKSVGVCYSADYGASWSKPEQILRNPLPRASPPDWGGCGDFSVVRVGLFSGNHPARDLTPMRWKYDDHPGNKLHTLSSTFRACLLHCCLT